MLLNADFSKPAVMNYDDAQWRPSPLAGVDRLMLDRIGEEKARATSIVRYARGSHFSEHVHELGEEFLVLEGVFSDDSGDFGPLTYVRNPDGSRHAPWSKDGCVIFVKLRQFDKSDQARVVVDAANADWTPLKAGGQQMLLHHYGEELVELVRLPKGAVYENSSLAHGVEILLLEGEVSHNGETLGSWSWLRVPAGGGVSLRAKSDVLIYRKTGTSVG